MGSLKGGRHGKPLLVVAFVALLLGGAFIGVLAAVGDDPAPPLERGLVATAGKNRGLTHPSDPNYSGLIGGGSGGDSFIAVWVDGGKVTHQAGDGILPTENGGILSDRAHQRRPRRDSHGVDAHINDGGSGLKGGIKDPSDTISKAERDG